MPASLGAAVHLFILTPPPLSICRRRAGFLSPNSIVICLRFIPPHQTIEGRGFLLLPFLGYRPGGTPWAFLSLRRRKEQAEQTNVATEAMRRGKRGSGRRRLRELTRSVVETMGLLEEVREKHAGVGGMSKALIKVRMLGGKVFVFWLSDSKRQRYVQQ